MKQLTPALSALYSTILREIFNDCNYKFSLEHYFCIIFAIIKGTKLWDCYLKL